MTSGDSQKKDIEYIKRDLANLDRKVDAGFADLKAQIFLMGDTFVRKDVHDQIEEEISNRIKAIEDANRWLFRTVVSTVIGLLATVILTLLK
jgi:hypothetical protein